MTLPQKVQDAVALADQFCGTYERGFAVKNAWTTIRAELHRLTEIAEGVDPLVIRLHDVTTRLEAADALHSWQPIESAPVGKKVIGVWLGAEGCEEIDLTVLCDALNEPPFWCSSHSLLERYTAPDFWQPLPPPPSTPEKAE